MHNLSLLPYKRFSSFVFIIISIFSCLNAKAQDDDSEIKKFCVDIDNKKAVSLYKKGTDKKKYKKPERMEFLAKCLEMEPDFAEANLAVANEILVRCKLDNKPFTPAIPFLMKAIKVCPQIHSEAYYYIGFDFYEQMKNDSAIRYLNLFLNFKDEDEKKFSKEYEGEKEQAKLMIKSAKKEMGLKKNVPFDPKVVYGVSTERDEYLAYVSPDDKFCFFVRRLPANNMDKVYASDKEREVFMVAKRDATGKFNAGEPMYYPFNETDDNQGGCTISINNKQLYFAMMKNEGGMQPNVDIYVSNNLSENFNEEWGPISKLSAVVNHPKYWDSQPTIAADGLTLYFASDRPGGYGGIDLWMTRKDPKTGQWSVPQNLGPNINTKGNEKTPFIHSDSETLYFSSDGHYGFGGYDIFYARKNEKGEWDEPVNIGSPINGESDDTGFFVSKDTKSGYFFSFDEGKVKGKGVGRYDLYRFDLYKEARPQAIAFREFEVKDEKGEIITGAIAELKNLNTGKKTNVIIDSLTGKGMYVQNLEKKDTYALVIKKDSVAFNSTIINTKTLSVQAEVPKLDIIVAKAEAGKSFVLDNIYYNTNSAEIQEQSKPILQSFAEYLLENPELKIEIQGHTDNVGNPKDNEALSSNRAYSVKQYLESFKVPGKRITAKGYGSTKPIADNKIESGRAKNRRTEFLIMGE
jgi:outer membrane protein OmpA-like peptidoglycan-associated protein